MQNTSQDGHSLAREFDKQLTLISRVLARIKKLGAQNWQLENLEPSYFIRETTIYSDYKHRHLFTYQNKAYYNQDNSYDSE